MKKSRGALIGAAVAALVAGLFGATTPAAQAQEAHYYILIGGTCDGGATVYNDAWLGGGIRKVVRYPAGAAGLPGCDQTPMDQSVAIGHEEAKRVVQDSFNENQGAEFTVVGYSQGALVANRVLNDIADGNLGVDKSRFTAKIYADPMQPVGPPGRGISAVLPPGTGAPSPFGGYVSFGPGREDFGGIPFIRYCIETDGVCHFDTPEAAGGYFAQHQCYQWARPADGRSIMEDTLADGVYTNASERLPRQNCRPPHPAN
ncbi:PE-PPE domain-containing protein [Amycolatopsis anabasis]|uniref:PE-PPE domain-containing protein n=1 Tax=Amycolatopsis anabasis TaxID=1840409 RepID=UPI00131C5F7E|nr:PE-PPE domain-containing protein [Amycolatopsis anabasis]